MSARKKYPPQQWVLDKREIAAIRAGRPFQDGVLTSEPKPKIDADPPPGPEGQCARVRSQGIDGLLRGRRKTRTPGQYQTPRHKTMQPATR